MDARTRKKVATALRAAADILARGEAPSSELREFISEHSEKANDVRGAIFAYRSFANVASRNPDLPKSLRKALKESSSQAFKDENTWEEIQKAPYRALR